MPEQGWYRAQEFAELAGVTVRTLHHYDRLGLLRPSRRSQTGYRLYHERDLERLEQIVALKFLGLSLAGIAQVLNSGTAQFSQELQRQKAALAGKRRHIDAAILAIDQLSKAASGNAHAGALLRQLIQVITMQNNSNWIGKYYSSQAQAKLAEKAQTFTLDMQADIAQQWKHYYRDLAQMQKDGDPDGSKADELVARHKKLIGEFTGGDPDIEPGLNAFYRDRANWPAEVKLLMTEYEGG